MHLNLSIQYYLFNNSTHINLFISFSRHFMEDTYYGQKQCLYGIFKFLCFTFIRRHL